VLAAALAPAAAAGGRRFPAPSCGWVPAREIGGAIDDPVSALAPAWTTDIAPVLTCGYVERQPKLQLGNVPLVTVQFRDQQLVRPPKGAVGVSHLGSCMAGVSCRAKDQVAWVYSLAGYRAVSDSPYAARFVKLEALGVQDGLNQITIVVDNPDGPLALADETDALVRIARRLLPRFYWG
jgi:hypothetical protein